MSLRLRRVLTADRSTTELLRIDPRRATGVYLAHTILRGKCFFPRRGRGLGNDACNGKISSPAALEPLSFARKANVASWNPGNVSCAKFG